MANKKENCLVIGGNGFLGINLVNKLLEESYNVRILSRSNNNIEKYVSNNIEYVSGDLNNRQVIKNAIKDIDIVFYFASSTNVITSSKDVYKDNENITHVLNVLEEIRGTNIKRFIFSSSGGTIYGEPKYLPIDEDHIPNPISPYGITKLSIEHYLHYYGYKYGLDYCICRYSNPYGEYQNPYGDVGAINIFLYKHLTGQTIDIYGNPNNIIRDYIYISDLADATIKLAFKETLKDRVFNVGTGIGTSLHEIIGAIERITGKKVEYKVHDNKKENVSRIILNINRITKEIQWHPIIGIEMGIKRSSEWIKSFLAE